MRQPRPIQVQERNESHGRKGQGEGELLRLVKHTCSKDVFFLKLGEAPDLMLKEKEVGRDNFSSNSSCINIAKHVLPTSGCLTNLCCLTLVSLQS
jgi:hypothetical protein